MSRFKFRVWDKEVKYMYGVKRINFETKLANLDMGEHNTFGCDRHFSVLVFMQCTGLKDKNGTLIYEGDILKIDNIFHPNKGWFSYYQVLWDGIRFAQKYLYDRGGKNHLTGNVLELSTFNMEHKEIIGNMFEYPELLKK